MTDETAKARDVINSRSALLESMAIEGSDELGVSDKELLTALAEQLCHVDDQTGQDRLDIASSVSNMAALACRFLSTTPSKSRRETDTNLYETALAILEALALTPGIHLDDSVLLAVIPHADPDVAWATPASVTASSTILTRQLSRRDKADFIVSVVVKETVMPVIFEKRRAGYVSQSEFATPGSHSVTSLSIDRPSLPPMVSWAMAASEVGLHIPQRSFAKVLSSLLNYHLQDELVRAHWNLFPPMILALLDDTDVAVKLRGTEAVSLFTEKCHAGTLHDKGVATILEDALVEILRWLPTHKPEDETARLLESTCKALVGLSSAIYAETGDSRLRRRSMDRVLQAIFWEYAHVSESPHIVQLLATQTLLIVNDLGIYATKYLKDLVSMYVRTLTDPFFDTHVGCLMAAADALASVIVKCWPRIQGRYDVEIVRGTAHCWLNIHNGSLAGSEADVRGLENALKRIVLLASVGRGDAEGDLDTFLGSLGSDNAGLGTLFQLLRTDRSVS